MPGIDLIAILAGAGVMLGGSIVGGLIYGIGLAADMGSDEETPESPVLSRSTITQLVILSVLCAALGGAVTGQMASNAPVTNALGVGILALALSFIPVRDLSRRVSILTGLASIPAAALGALLVT
ncbi:hypothetical protein [Maritimibacter dapengensis]|uniref:Uncharacterized protein n=1 Tax=Maritimibacter dapengensis TaxID=2836868 RepID=A0ABS6T295_9RHOB|nr:hypothetical protein [Maritimibacter dapengensis]MBV7379371.1 hypothetical protein [Maritimibacter dapengensis]